VEPTTIGETEMTTYTTTRELNTEVAHAHEFYSVDYDIAYNDQLELVERFADSLEYEFKYDSNQRPSDMVHQIVDEWLTTGDYAIAEMWLRANCPQPDINLDYTTKGELPIIRQMISALYEIGYGFLSALIDSTDDIRATYIKISTIYPTTE
jgi:hypothetical protein